MARKTPEQLDAEIAKYLERAKRIDPNVELEFEQREPDWWVAQPKGKKFAKNWLDNLAGGRSRERAEGSARDKLTEERRRLDRKVRDLQSTKESALKSLQGKAGKERDRARELASGESGTCQICAGTQKIVRGKISLHGYQRPGIGFIIGNCFGAQQLPFEQSCDRLREWVGKLEEWLEGSKRSLEKLPTKTEFLVKEYVTEPSGRFVYERGSIKTKLVTIGPMDKRYPKAQRAEERRLKAEIGQLESDIRMQSARLAGWRRKP